jgi:hypothetical protein
MTSRHTEPDLRSLVEQNTCWYDRLGKIQFVNVGVEDSVDKANAWRLVRVRVGELDMDLPGSTFEWSFGRSLEPDIELLHVVVNKCDFIVAHEHLHDICLYPTARATHDGG